jgi:hypothetical protein
LRSESIVSEPCLTKSSISCWAVLLGKIRYIDV